MSVALLVVVLVAVSAVGWVAIVVWLRSRLLRLRAEMIEDARRAGEALRIPPRSALYQGNTAERVPVRGNGILCVTERRVWFRRAVGDEVSIALDDVDTTALASTFRGRSALGTGAKAHLVVRLRDGAEVGFTVREAEEMRSAIGR
jgi:hypothetical protein